MSYSLFSKILQKIKDQQRDVILSAVIVLITVISFQSGKISALKGKAGDGIAIKEASLEEIFITKSEQPKNTPKFGVVASKNSNKYHFSWCPGTSKISDKNKITFPTEAAAIAAGLILASNCKK